MQTSRDMEQLLARFRAGATLAELGEAEGISRERVRQLLLREGVTGGDGGRAARMRTRMMEWAAQREEQIQRQNAWIAEHYGPAGLEVSPEVRRAYRLDQRNAKGRNIPWALPFAVWWRLWQPHWPKRGRGLGHCGLWRINPARGYEPGNVEIRELSHREER